ncbi:MAG: DUF1836 domain-containing protein [Clostridiales bacterium]|nr:DUF1836 domain-containing protein [Clostridiales bacterium]
MTEQAETFINSSVEPGQPDRVASEDPASHGLRRRVSQYWRLPTNPFDKIGYSNHLGRAKMFKLLEQRGIHITRAMFANYMAKGALPPPVDGRSYTHWHVALLALIDWLKHMYSIDELAMVLKRVEPLPVGELWRVMPASADDPVPDNDEALSVLMLMIKTECTRRAIICCLASDTQ